MTRRIRKNRDKSNIQISNDLNHLEYKPDYMIPNNVRLPRSNIQSAKRIYSSIKRTDKNLGRNLHKQDFKAVQYDSASLQNDALAERNEANKLDMSQGSRRQLRDSEARKRMAEREAIEQKKREHAQIKMTKTAIKTHKRSKRHAKKQARIDQKLRRMQGRM